LYFFLLLDTCSSSLSLFFLLITRMRHSDELKFYQGKSLLKRSNSNIFDLVMNKIESIESDFSLECVYSRLYYNYIEKKRKKYKTIIDRDQFLYGFDFNICFIFFCPSYYCRKRENERDSFISKGGEIVREKNEKENTCVFMSENKKKSVTRSRTYCSRNRSFLSCLTVCPRPLMMDEQDV